MSQDTLFGEVALKGRKNFSKNDTGFRRAADMYETPYSMTRQLLDVERFAPGEDTLEPACGNGAILDVLIEAGFDSWLKNDLMFDWGKDFLAEDWDACRYVITNPPYRLATEFILKAKTVADWKIAFLLPTDYLHGAERYERVFQDTVFPLARVWTFIRRPMLGDAIRKDGKYRTGMQTYAWFVWDKTHRGPAELGWIDNQEFVLKAGE